MHVHRIGDVTVLNDYAEILDSGSCPSTSLFFMTSSPWPSTAASAPPTRRRGECSCAGYRLRPPVGHAGRQRPQALAEGIAQ
jgi:hypothetical protein